MEAKSALWREGGVEPDRFSLVWGFFTRKRKRKPRKKCLAGCGRLRWLEKLPRRTLAVGESPKVAAILWIAPISVSVFQHSYSVWLRVPRQWPGMPRSASLASVTNCCWIHPTFFYLKWRPSREWWDTSQIHGLFRPQKLVEASSNSTTINLLKLPKMWRLLIRVEKRLMVLSFVPEPTRRNIQHL